MIDLDNQNQTADPLVFTLLPGPIIKLKTTDPTKARPFRLGLVAQVLTKKKATILNVAVSDVCPSATLVAQVIPDQVYQVGNEIGLTIQWPSWSDTSGNNLCGDSTFSAVFESSGNSLDPTWISFDATARRIRVKTSDDTNVGMHSIKVSGKLLSSGRTTSTSFNIEVIDPCTSAQVVPAAIPDFQIKAGSPKKEILLDSWTDTLSGKCGPFTFTLTYQADS